MDEAATLQPSSPSKHLRILTGLCLAPSLALLISGLVPLVHYLPAYQHDWLMAMSELRGRGLTYGRDLAFTFGPWGFVWGGYHPRTFIYTCLAWIVIATVAWWVLFRIVRLRISNPMLQGLTLLGVTLFCGGDLPTSPDTKLLIPPLLFLVYHFFTAPGANDPAKLALAAIIGFTATIKFTCFVTGVAMIGFVTIDQLARPSQRKPWAALAFVLSLISAWVSAGQSLGDLPAYVRVSLLVSSTFAEAMNVWRSSELANVTIGLLPQVLLLILVTIAGWKSLKWRMVILFPALFTLLLIAFRHGYVREDEHVLITTSFALAAVPLVYLAVSSHVRSARARVAWAVCFVCALWSASMNFRWVYTSVAEQLAHPLGNLVAETAELGRLLVGHELKLHRDYSDAMAAIRMQNPLPPVVGTSDAYPSQLNELFASGLNYSPRPTLQAYGTYSAKLGELNAAKYAGPNAPDNVFFAIAPLDYRVPAIEDNLLWLEILKRYELKQALGTMLHLVKRPAPRQITKQLLSTSTIQLGGVFAFPADQTEPLWLELDIGRRSGGKVLAQFFKPPPLMITYRTRDGVEGTYRLIPANAGAGFLVAPLVISNATFAALLNSTPTYGSSMPREIIINGPMDRDVTWYFDSTLTLRLFRLSFQ